jgi:hypothetical protein
VFDAELRRCRSWVQRDRDSVDRRARHDAQTRMLEAVFVAVVIAGTYALFPRFTGPQPHANGVAAHEPASALPRSASLRRADFRGAPASREAKAIADWSVATDDHAGAPFVIVDKKHARIYAFDGAGALTVTAPALLGAAYGDTTVPGIGDKALSDIPASERTTAAGRFVAELGQELGGGEVLWVDYDSGLSLHRVYTGTPSEHRQQRLDTPTIADNRISWGCINVPAAFFDRVVLPAFRHSKGIVYVLPEILPLDAVFASYARYRTQMAARRRDAQQLANR